MNVIPHQQVDFLIVDDDHSITRFLATYLEQKGHSCAALTEGFQTASWLQTNDCEVAIVDLNMPKVDGISVITYLRDVNPTLPVIVFTGAGYDEQQMHAALRAGANGYVSKNLPAEQLYCVLARVLATTRQRARRAAVSHRERPALLGAA